MEKKSLRKKKFITGNCIIASLIVVNKSENAWNDWRMPLLSAAKALRVNELQRVKSESGLRTEEAFHKHTLNLLFQRNSLLCTRLGACRSCFIVIEEALLRGLKRESLIYSTKCSGVFFFLHSLCLCTIKFLKLEHFSLETDSLITLGCLIWKLVQSCWWLNLCSFSLCFYFFLFFAKVAFWCVLLLK